MDNNIDRPSGYETAAVTNAVAADLRRIAGSYRTFAGFFYRHPAIDPAELFPAGDPEVAALIDPTAYETTMVDLERERATAAALRNADILKHSGFEAAIHDGDASYFADARLLHDLERKAMAKLNDKGEVR